MTTTTTPEQKSPFWRTILYAIALALAIRSFVFEPFTIPSSSMYPNLLIGDYLFVSKFPYGYSRYSLPFFGQPAVSGRLLYTAPQRGDVVVFRHVAVGKDYIKRVIGLPGDSVQMIAGRLYLNDVEVPREVIEPYYTGDSIREPLAQYWETLPNGVRHKIIEISDTMPLDNTPRYVVPADHFFMMGDNRDNSADSRADVGFVPADQLIGRAEMVLVSSASDSFILIWNWLLQLRLERFFTWIR